MMNTRTTETSGESRSATADVEAMMDAVLRALDEPPALVLACHRLLSLLPRAPESTGLRRLSAAAQGLYAYGLTRTPHGDPRRNRERARTALHSGIDTYRALRDGGDFQDGDGQSAQESLLTWLDGVPAASAVAGGRHLTVYAGRLTDAFQYVVRDLCGSPDRARAEYTYARRLLDDVSEDAQRNTEAAIAHLLASVRGHDRDREPTRWADAQLRLGTCYVSRAHGARRTNLERAIACYESALAVRDHGSGWRRWPTAMTQLAQAYSHRIAGNHAENTETALVTYQNLLATLTPELDPGAWSGTQHGIGLLYSHRVHGDRAENLERAIGHLQESLLHIDAESDAYNCALTHQALAAAYDYRITGARPANRRLAISHLETALRGATRERFPTLWASLKTNLGLVHGAGDSPGAPNPRELEEAARHLEDALTVRTREAMPVPWARTTDRLAAMYIQRAGNDAAEYAERAIAMLHSTSAVHDRLADPEAWARNRLTLAMALQRRTELSGQPSTEERAALYRSLLAHYSVDNRPDGCMHVAAELGQALGDLGRWPAAAEAFGTALEALESLIAPSLTAASRTHLSGSGTVTRWASYAMARDGRLREAVVTLERGRARALGEALDRDHTDLAGLRNGHPDLYAAYREACERLRRVQDRDLVGDPDLNGNEADIEDGAYDGIAAEEDGPPEDDRARGTALIELAEEVRAARAQLTGVVERIRAIDGHEDFLDTPDWETVTAAVEPDAPLAYVNTTPWGTLTLLLTRPEPGAGTVEIHPLWCDVTQDDIDRLLHRSSSPDALYPIVSGFLMRQYNLVQTTFPDGSSALTSGYWDVPGSITRTGLDEDGGMDMLGRRVVARLARTLAGLGAGRVTLIPCGTLLSLPLHTAYYDEGPDRRCLLNDVDVGFAASARAVRHARDRVHRTWGAPALAGVGNPLPHPAPLRFASLELSRVAPLFATCTTLYEEQATKPGALRAASGATYVHLACHGALDFGGENPTLQLAGTEDLTLEEIARERPFAGARLVVLSACQSAVGSRSGAIDEVVGLPTAIMSAGTPGVIGALWPVDDLSTTLLMERFYTLHLRGDERTGEGPMPPIRALARAQLWLATVTCAELHQRFLREAELLDTDGPDVDRPEPGGTPPHSGPSATATAAASAARFGLDDPGTRPFSNSFYWAPFVFMGE
ncbi:CHAT domain-containing protein [Streptomyces sp. NPDC021969]|uniref:CHAT domain-containing protein n=1 Tax=unclassified Streptomyces TaxID=2593676 RepID=UPI0033DED67C